MSNITNSKKKDLIYQLINKLEEASYQERSALTDQLRATLKFITPESETVLKRITSTGRMMLFSTSESENLRNRIQLFESFRNNAISNLNGLLTEIDLFEYLEEPSNQKSVSENLSLKVPKQPKKKIFIVHGHDDNLKSEVALFVERQGLESVILHQQASGGKTIIEKLEERSDVGFAIVLYTPCDIGRVSTARKNNPRARQNVVFEHGFFIGKIGRGKVVALVKGSIEIPNDYSGVVYVSHNDNGAWKTEIGRELAHAGYTIDFMKF